MAACGFSATQAASNNAVLTGVPIETELLTAETELLPTPTQIRYVAETPQPTPSAAPVQTTPQPPTPMPVERFAAGKPGELTNIQMFDPTTGWAKVVSEGVEDHILRTSDGGATWKDVTPPELVLPEMHALVYFLDSDNAWAVYLHYDRSRDWTVWHTGDGGESWELSDALDTHVEGATFFSPGFLNFVDKENGWLMVNVDGGMGRQYVALYRTSTAGKSWTKIYEPVIGESEGDLHRREKTGWNFFDSKTGLVSFSPWAIDNSAVAWTRDGGLTWEMDFLPNPDKDSTGIKRCNRAFSPMLLSPNTAVVGVLCESNSPNPFQTFVYITEDGGQTWRINSYPGGELDFITPDVGWARGRSLYFTQDGGQTWDFVKSVNWDGQFSFVNDQLGWAVATNEDEIALVRTVDGGWTWELLDPIIAP